MAWYIRKSFKLSSLLRVNLSKSGLGYSFGMKGARIGTGPRGNYIHLGRYGLYYRQSLPSFGTEGKAGSNGAPMAKAVPGPEQEVPIITADASALKDHSAQQLLTEIQEKHGIMRVAPIVSAVFGLTILLSLVLQLSLWLSGFLMITALIAYLRLARFDRERKTVALHFELDDFARARYEAFSSTLQSFASSSAIWTLTSQQSVIDPKYHAGAATIVDKTLARMALGAPPFVQTEITVWHLTLRDQTLYLFPDRILVYQGNEVGAIPYCDLHLSLQETRFVEKSYVPADATVVDHTWRYTNRDGGPDRRFANNSQIPVVRYGEIHITSSAGLNILLDASNVEKAQAFVSGITEYCHYMSLPKHEGTTDSLPESANNESVPQLETAFHGSETVSTQSPLPKLESTSTPQTPGAFKSLPDASTVRDLSANDKSLKFPLRLPGDPTLNKSEVVLSYRFETASSPNGRFVLGWGWALGGYRIVMMKEGQILWQRDFEYPGGGVASDNGWAAVVKKWEPSAFAVFDADGEVVLRHDVKDTRVEECGLDPKGMYAWCSTGFGIAQNDKNKLLLFSISPPTLLLKTDKPRWPVTGIRQVEDQIEVETSQIKHLYSQSGELLNRAEVETAWERFVVSEGNPLDLLSIANQHLQLTVPHKMTPDERESVIGMLHRVLAVSPTRTHERARANRMLGEIALACEDKSTALVHFKAALGDDPKIGVALLAKRLEREVNSGTSKQKG
jgi:hypothetical protein